MHGPRNGSARGREEEEGSLQLRPRGPASSHAGSRTPPTPSPAAGKEPAVLVQMPPSLFFSYNYVSEG